MHPEMIEKQTDIHFGWCWSESVWIIYVLTCKLIINHAPASMYHVWAVFMCQHMRFYIVIFIFFNVNIAFDLLLILPFRKEKGQLSRRVMGLSILRNKLKNESSFVWWEFKSQALFFITGWFYHINQWAVKSKKTVGGKNIR